MADTSYSTWTSTAADAFVVIGKDQGRRFGPNAAPQTIGGIGEIGQAFADGVTTMGAVLGASPRLAGEIQQSTVTLAEEKLGKFEIKIDSFLPTNKIVLGAPANVGVGSFFNGTAVDRGYIDGNQNEEIEAKPELKIGLNKLLLNAYGIGEDATNKLKTSLKQISTIKTIAGASEIFQSSVHYIMNRAEGIDGDIAIATYGANAPYAYETSTEANVNLRIPGDRMIEHADLRAGLLANVPARMNQARQVTATTMAMFAGVTDPRERQQLADYFNNNLRQAITDEYNRMARASGGAYEQVADFFQMFVQPDATGRNQMAGPLAALFANPNTPGSVLQNIFNNVATAAAYNTSLPSNLRANMGRLVGAINTQADFHTLLNGFGNAVAGNNNLTNMTDLVNTGLGALVNAHNAAGNTAMATRLAGVIARLPAMNGQMTVLDRMNFAVARVMAVDDLTKVLTPGALFLGDPLVLGKLANALGGWGGSNVVSNPRGLNPLMLLGTGWEAHRLTAYTATATPRGPMSWLYGKSETRNGVTTWRDEGAFAQYGKITWAPAANSNFMQKGAYLAHVLNPWQMTKGFLNGSLLQHMLILGSDYGRIPAATNTNLIFRFARHMITGTSLDARAYRTLIRGWNQVQLVINLPAKITEKALTIAKEVIWDKIIVQWLWAWFMKLAAKFGFQVALETLLGVVTAGISEVFIKVYQVLNFISFGALDKIIFGLIGFTFQLIVAIVLFLLALAVFFSGSLSGGIQGITSSLGTGGLFAPNPLYAPMVETYQPDRPGGGGGGKPYPPGKTINLPGAKGIDISHWDGQINWPVVKTSGMVEFAIIKATEGTNFLDDKFAYNWKESKNVGIKRGAYHFFLPQYNGTQQADFFMDTVLKAGGGEDIQLSVDVEQPCKLVGSACVPYGFDKNVSTRNLKLMVDRIEQRAGYKPIIYTSKVMWNLMTTNPSWGGDAYPLWVAAWTSGNSPGALPPGWNDWLIWQYSALGVVPGIPASSVDMNVWRK